MSEKPTRPDTISYDLEDYDIYIKELQRILAESPPGMQARFARLINYLSKKRDMIKKLSPDDADEIDPKKLYQSILKDVEEELEMPINSEEKFSSLLELARLRECISEQKKKMGLY